MDSVSEREQQNFERVSVGGVEFRIDEKRLSQFDSAVIAAKRSIAASAAMFGFKQADSPSKKVMSLRLLIPNRVGELASDDVEYALRLQANGSFVFKESGVNSRTSRENKGRDSVEIYNSGEANYLSKVLERVIQMADVAGSDNYKTARWENPSKYFERRRNERQITPDEVDGALELLTEKLMQVAAD